jgi:hypothetical protein
MSLQGTDFLQEQNSCATEKRGESHMSTLHCGLLCAAIMFIKQNVAGLHMLIYNYIESYLGIFFVKGF